jgi:hypothetical protein
MARSQLGGTRQSRVRIRHPAQQVAQLRSHAVVVLADFRAEIAQIDQKAERITELMRLTRIELYGLLTRITTALADFPEGSAERVNALLNLGNIRRVRRGANSRPRRG